MTVINESGFYSLVLRSNMPKAREFKRWVTSEVLPSIRKTGIYATTATIDRILNNPDFGIKLLEQLKVEREERERLQSVVEIQSVQIAELTPKASYYDRILQSSEAINIGTIAKDYGLSAKAMNKLLYELKIQFPSGGTWLPYQKFAGQGFTTTKVHEVNNGIDTFTKTITCWTQKGRIFLYEKLKEAGYLPLIERGDEAA